MIMDEEEYWQRITLAVLQAGDTVDAAVDAANRLVRVQHETYARHGGRATQLPGEARQHEHELRVNCKRCGAINIVLLTDLELQQPYFPCACEECGQDFVINPTEEMCSP